MNVTSFTTTETKTAGPSILVVEPEHVVDSDGGRSDLAGRVRHRVGDTSNVISAAGAPLAVKHLLYGNVKIVLVDSRMPTTAAQSIFLRAAELPHNVAVVVVDWEDEPSFADSRGQEWIQRGADDFLLAGELSSRRIGIIMAKSHQTRRLRRENAHIHKQLRHAGREFDHFVRALSHDMMANFMLLESSFSQLRNELDNDANSESGRIFAHASACLRESKRFLDDLVQLAKTGAVEMDPQRVELKTIVDEVLFEQHELIANGGLQIEVQPQMPAVWCNRQRVKQVVTNLVRNAIKHGCDPDDPKISISALCLPEITSSFEDAKGDCKEGSSKILLRVHDNGTGIDFRMHKEIFLPGRRLANSSEDGSGMGLAIVRKIANHYGGSAWVDSRTARGTGIIVSFPAVPSGVEMAAKSENTNRQKTFDSKILRGRSPAALHQPHMRPNVTRQ